MDIDKLTIPPELFYSTKTVADTWKPHAGIKPSPVRTTKSFPKTFRKFTGKRTKLKINKAPELGRIGKFKHVLVKKKLIPKKKKVAQETYKTSQHGLVDDHQLFDKENQRKSNNNVSNKPPTKQEERIILKQFKAHDESIKRKMYSVEKKRKKPKRSSSFKFFKTKNDIEEESSSSDECDDLVPEIRDFSESQSSPEIVNKTKSPRKVDNSIILDPDTFDDEADSVIDGTTFAIESLLMNLDSTEFDVTVAPTKQAGVDMEDLDSLIETLGGSSVAENIKTPEKRPAKEVKRVRFMGLGEKQMQLDAGQKKFGLVECMECGFSYNTNVPEDEKIHNKHHQAVTTIPKFKGWAQEEAINIKEWSEQGGRIIHLQPNHKNIGSEYVKEIVTRMETEFGIQDEIEKFHVYLAVYDTKIVGIATAKDSVKAKRGNYKTFVKLGIQRLFVRPEFRREGFATTLLKTIVMMHNKGDLLDLKTDVAFSCPTEDGKKLIESVIGSDQYFTFTS